MMRTCLLRTTYRPDAVSSALYDQNTLDDPPTCTAPSPP